MCCPETPLRRMLFGRFLPFGPVIGVGGDIPSLLGQFVVLKV